MGSSQLEAADTAQLPPVLPLWSEVRGPIAPRPESNDVRSWRGPHALVLHRKEGTLVLVTLSAVLVAEFAMGSLGSRVSVLGSSSLAQSLVPVAAMGAVALFWWAPFVLARAGYVQIDPTARSVSWWLPRDRRRGTPPRVWSFDAITGVEPISVWASDAIHIEVGDTTLVARVPAGDASEIARTFALACSGPVES